MNCDSLVSSREVSLRTTVVLNASLWGAQRRGCEEAKAGSLSPLSGLSRQPDPGDTLSNSPDCEAYADQYLSPCRQMSLCTSRSERNPCNCRGCAFLTITIIFCLILPLYVGQYLTFTVSPLRELFSLEYLWKCLLQSRYKVKSKLNKYFLQCKHTQWPTQVNRIYLPTVMLENFITSSWTNFAWYPSLYDKLLSGPVIS